MKDIKTRSKEEIQKILSEAWLNVYINEDTLHNPLINLPKEFNEQAHLYFLYIMSRPEYFSFFCKEILNIELLPFQCVIQRELWTRKFPMLIGSRGLGKTFSLALYSLLRAVFLPGRKIVIAGAGFRQSKLVFDYIENIWKNSPLLRDFVGNPAYNRPIHATDTCKFTFNESSIIAIPVGTGDKIRGLRSNDLIVDEFSAHSEEIFENVIAGFGAVSSNPSVAAKQKAADMLARKFGIELDEESETTKIIGNQIVISGTAYYYFNHFYKYWKRWKTIIESNGKAEKLKSIFPDGIPEGFDHTAYSIMRIPVEILPPGFMDAGQIARSKATLHTGLFNMEFSAIFSEDSQGFYRASLIQSCVCNAKNNIIKSSSEDPIVFSAKIDGDVNKKYVYAIDPASEQDNFALVILELHKDHRRIVHAWTTNSKDFKEKRKSGEISETDFYGFCARKIRNLMKTFPTSNIAIDSQGGGKAIYEALHDRNKLEANEQMIWEVIEPGVNKDCDGEEGLHIVHLINFAKEEFTSTGNHGMKKDFEDKVLLFPEFDIAKIALLLEIGDSIALSMEDCMTEIEELKKELTQIIVTSTASGRERWDTPEVKISGSEKGRLRKDRYSALLMANYVARNLTETPQIELSIGGFARQSGKTSGNDYVGPAWMTSQLNNLYD